MYWAYHQLFINTLIVLWTTLVLNHSALDSNVPPAYEWSCGEGIQSWRGINFINTSNQMLFIYFQVFIIYFICSFIVKPKTAVYESTYIDTTKYYNTLYCFKYAECYKYYNTLYCFKYAYCKLLIKVHSFIIMCRDVVVVGNIILLTCRKNLNLTYLSIFAFS